MSNVTLRITAAEAEEARMSGQACRIKPVERDGTETLTLTVYSDFY